jgi:hypothetical protein
MAIMVPSDGVPAGPWKISKLEVKEPAEAPLGGMNVKEANKNWTKVRTIGGSCKRKIRMAIVSYMGQDLRMVEARWSGLTEALEPDLLEAVAGFSVRRAASPGRHPFCGTAPLA